MSRIAHAVIAGAILIAVPGAAMAAPKSAADQALYQRAVKDCSSPKWSNGARPYINYAGGWYRCVEPHTK